MPRFAANLSMLYNDVDFLDRFAAAARDGFKAVEYLFPYAYPAQELAARLQANGLQQVLFNAPPGNWDAGERGLACLPGREAEFREGIAKAIDYAKALQCPRIHVMAGLVPQGADAATVRATYIANVRYAAEQAAPHGIQILLEPINGRDMPGFFLSRQDQAHALIAEIGATNVKVQMDLYHCQIVEGDLAMKVRQYLPTGNVGHFQIAGVPERHEPDVGEINYTYLFQLLDSLGYDGWIGCEYRPARGAVFAANPAVVAQAVQQLEQIGVVDLAHIGFVALGHTGNLEVADIACGQVLAHLHGQVAFHDLAVVQVHLHLDVGGTDLGDQRMGLVLAAEEEAGHVAAIDGLQQDLDAVRRSLLGGVAHVGDVGGAHGGCVRALGHKTGHHVDARALQRLGVVDGLGNAFAELGLTPRQAGQPTFARVPVAGRGVEQHLLQAVGLQARGQFLRRVGVGKQVLHRLETIAGGGSKTVEKVHVVVEHGQVGGKAGHKQVPEEKEVSGGVRL